MDNDKTNIFTDIFKCLEKKALGNSFRLVRTFIDNNPDMMYNEELESIERDYRLMLDYFKQGFEDPHRTEVYEKLLCRLYKFTCNLLLSYRIKNDPFYSEAARKSAGRSLSNDRIKAELENFVTDVALLSLEPEKARETKSREIYRNHNEFIQTLFCHIVASRQWTDADAAFFEDLLLSPTTDSIDSQVIISAMTIAVMNIMDIRKFGTLVNIYDKSDDEHIRQKALVGWVFALSSDMNAGYEIRETLSEVLRKPDVINELSDLQKQIIFCMNAEKDNDMIQKDIMPDIIKNNNLNITRFGITEKEEDPMADVFDPGAADRTMEKMEESFRKMINMQKAGSDIYFGGFSQMKRFPFFNSTANWFYPFYLEHPEISSVTDRLKDTPLLAAVLKNGPFCDSDKYSFTLAMSTVISRLPENMRDALSSPESLGQVVSDEDQKNPAYIRRMILQDMYRFFRLFPQRGRLVSPFDATHFVFVTNDIFNHTDMQDVMPELCYFMLKHKNGTALGRLLDKYDVPDDPKCMMFHGIYELDYRNDPDCACRYFEALMRLEPESRRGLSLLARTYFLKEDYNAAAGCYGRLYNYNTENRTATLNYCISLAKAQRYDEAINLLYKLNIEEPESMQITRVLAWTLMGLDKLEQAEKEYERLIRSKDAETGDWLNGGYCQWFRGNTVQAVTMFNTFMETFGDRKGYDNISEEFEKDRDFLKAHGIKDIDIMLMTDLINANGGQAGN